MSSGGFIGGSLAKRLKEEVCIVTSHLPDEMQKYVTKYVWFVGSMDDAWGFVFTGNDLLDQHLIFLSDDLLNQDEEQIHWSIAHEIGHVILKHKNNIFFLIYNSYIIFFFDKKILIIFFFNREIRIIFFLIEKFV